MTLSFDRRPPAPDLEAHIENFWFMRGAGPSAMPDGHRILPDGCMEFVFQLGDAFLERQPGGDWRLQATRLFVGQMERRTDIRPSGVIHTVGVHFRPAGAAAFVAGDLRRFVNRILPLDEVLGEDLETLTHSLQTSRTQKAQVSIIERDLRARLKPGDPEMAEAADRLSDPGLPIDIEAMATGLKLSDRQFRRRFEAAVGLGPKRFARLVRFQRVFEQRREEDGRAWSDVALECGYYDQSHFNRDFRAFTGVKPRDIVRDADPLTAFFLSVSSKTRPSRRG